MKILKNPHYMMDMGVGGDIWKLYGEVFNHPRFNDGETISTSTPQSIEEYDQGIYKMITCSGSVYLLEQPSDDVLNQIRKDIEKKGYEVH